MLSIIKSVVEYISRLSGNADAVKRYILVFVLLLIAAWATKCRAADLAIETGSTYLRGEGPALAVTQIFKNAGPLDTDYECGIVLSPSSHENGEFQRNNAAVNCTMVDGFGPVKIGIGLAYLFATDAYNGSNVNFSLELGYQVNDRYAVVLRHFSNLGTTLPNLGRDFVFLQRKF